MSRFLKLIVGIVILALVFYFSDFNLEDLKIIKEISVFSIALSLIVGTINRIIMSFKWDYLVSLNSKPLGLTKSIQVYCTSQLYGVFLPSTIGPDMIRIGLSKYLGRKSHVIAASIVIERILGLITTLVIFNIFFIFLEIDTKYNNYYLLFKLIFISLLILISSIVFISFNRKLYNYIYDNFLKKYNNAIIKFIQKIHQSYLEYADKKKQLLIFCILSIFEILSGSLFIYFIINSFDVHVSFFDVFIAFNIASFVSRVAISPSGLGVFEAGFVGFLSLKGISPEISLMTAFLSRVLQITIWIPWWLSFSPSLEKFNAKDQVAQHNKPSA